MEKDSVFHRALSLLLVFAFVFTIVQADIPEMHASAASVVTNTNLLKHSTFEETDVDLPYAEYGVPRLDNWYYYGSSQKVNQDAHDGEWAVEESTSGDSLEQEVKGLKVGATYEVSVWAKVTDPSASVYFGVKNYGGDEVKQKITSTEYQQYTIPFTYSGSANALAYIWSESLSNGAKVYMDDFSMSLKSDLQEVGIENGSVSITFKDSAAENMKKENFDITYKSSIDEANVKPLTITDEEVNGNVLKLNFDPIPAAAVQQTATVDLAYKPSEENEVWTVDFSIAPDGSQPVVAGLSSINVSNGSVKAVLDQAPTVAPVLKDFIVEKSVDGSAFQAVNVNSFSYDKAAKTVTLGFPQTGSANAAKKVTVKVTYADAFKTADFTVEANQGISYYVDAVNGNDSNDGKTPQTAVKSITRVNSIMFHPGDKLLFHCGQTWAGELMPKGSGAEGSPIIIKSYGSGPKPVIMPGADRVLPYFNVASNVNRNQTINNVITFSNQEYWEVRDLELYDPKFSSIDPNTTTVFRRAVNIIAEDTGDLHYFVFNNLTIHGFRGPNSNVGKSSGGIIVTVLSNPDDARKRVPTAVDDITVTNCEMYDLGRSGFNFSSPWTTRVGSEWGTFGYSGYGEWRPNQNITIKNNTIYNIDGDGILIDGCKNVMVEHNTVYKAATNSAYAVCIFNWNSDNTVFQFNEAYDAAPAGSPAWDGQGIEIDALNRDTYVQYNYMHDNGGGSFMWCSADEYRSFRGIYRYNIMQNDLTKSGVIDWRPNQIDSMAYNNTIYLGKLPAGQKRKFMSVTDTTPGNCKFYNNIFYNQGELDVNDFHETEIDWKNNIFYNFSGVPANDINVITENPKFVNPGSGALGISSVSGYKLQAGSPAINAGLTISDNGGRDYFGTALSDGKTDIGAAEYVSASSQSGHGSSGGSAGAGTDTGTAPLVPATSFKLDTTATYTFGVGGVYSFLVKTISQTIPTVTSSSKNVAVAFSKKVDGGYLFQITGGGEGSALITAQIGNEFATFPVVVNGKSVKSDTTHPFTMKAGAKYCFKFTVNPAGKGTTSFTVGNGTVFYTRFVKRVGNDYYFEIQSTGMKGISTGVYTTMPGQKPVLQCVVGVA